MIDRMKRLSAPLQLLTPQECADIVFWERREDIERVDESIQKS